MEVTLSLLIIVAYCTCMLSLYQVVFKGDTADKTTMNYYAILPLLVGFPTFFMVIQFMHTASVPLQFAVTVMPFIATISTFVMFFYLLKQRYTA